jgi:enoyl-CoA hydratase
MRYMLTGDEFGAEEARRMQLVSEVVAPELLLERAVALAERIATAAPLGVGAVIESANTARSHGDDVALASLFPSLSRLIMTDDAREGAMAGMERREPKFVGR